MSNPEDNTCARDGCRFHVELVMVANMALPGVYCSDACADYAWLRRGLASMKPTPDVLALAADLRTVARILDERTDPTQIGALIDA